MRIINNTSTLWRSPFMLDYFFQPIIYRESGVLRKQNYHKLLLSQDTLTPKRCPVVQKSEPVDENQMVSVTCCSTGIVFLIIVSFFLIIKHNSLHMYKNVAFDIQKFSNQSYGINIWSTTCSHHWVLLGLTHNDLTTGE